MSDRIKNKLINELKSFGSYEEMHKFIKEGVVGTKKIPVEDIALKVPGLYEEINLLMLDTIISEQGNPDSPGFTFSRNVSNERILEIIGAQDELEGKLTDLFGPTGEERDSKITELENKMLDRNNEYKNTDIKISNLQEALRAQRAEFDKRAKISPLNIFPGMGIQMLLGLSDIARREGLEKIENRDWYWDPKYEKFGPDQNIKDTQKVLEEEYNKRAAIKPEYQESSDLYNNYKTIVKSQEHNARILNKTGVDEALNYISLDQLTKMLESK
tara:strand:- start:5682 stop:6497 length:816 start_codon:yes stop_codon:yes gene_type:complete